MCCAPHSPISADAMHSPASATPPVVLILGGPLPPPFGGIAAYLQRSLPHVASAGFKLLLVEPPECGQDLEIPPGAPEAEVIPLPNYSLADTLRYLLRRPRMALKLLRWYLPTDLRRSATAREDLLAAAKWAMSGESVLAGRSPDLVHAYDAPWRQGAAAVLLAKKYGCPSLLSTFGEVVPHVDELELHDELSEKFRRTSRSILCSADLVASMTEHCRRQVDWLGLGPDRVKLVRLVVGMERFSPEVDGAAIRERHELGGNQVLLFVGQLRPRKGPQTLIDAMPGIVSEVPNVRALFVGPDHGVRDQLERQARENGVADHVTFTGPVGDDLLPAYYAACDAFIFPTLTPIECLGLTFVQAMFAAKPVIATRIAGAPEVVRDEVDGYLVEPADAGELATAAVRMLKMEQTARQEMGTSARARVLDLYDEDQVLDDILDTYRTLTK